MVLEPGSNPCRSPFRGESMALSRPFSASSVNHSKTYSGLEFHPAKKIDYSKTRAIVKLKSNHNKFSLVTFNQGACRLAASNINPCAPEKLQESQINALGTNNA